MQVCARVQDEMKALQMAYTTTFTLGFLGFLSSEILDLVCLYNPTRGARLANKLIQRSLQALMPHFVFARCAPRSGIILSCSVHTAICARWRQPYVGSPGCSTAS